MTVTNYLREGGYDFIGINLFVFCSLAGLHKILLMNKKQDWQDYTGGVLASEG